MSGRASAHVKGASYRSAPPQFERIAPGASPAQPSLVQHGWTDALSTLQASSFLLSGGSLGHCFRPIILVLLGGPGSHPGGLLSPWRDLGQVSNRFDGKPNIFRVL